MPIKILITKPERVFDFKMTASSENENGSGCARLKIPFFGFSTARSKNSTLQHKDKIIAILGKEKVFAREDGQLDIATFDSYGTDRTKVYTPNYDLLTFPRTTEEVAALVKYAYENDIKVVPSGGRTGYAGGAIAKDKELVISLSKMDQVIDFDPFFASLTVGGDGVTCVFRAVR